MKNKNRHPALVLGVAGGAYLLAVSQRSTLGAAAILATNRYHISGEQLAMLAVAQLAIYAIMQIPVGVLLDRFGSRALLTFGGICMVLGQVLVAFAQTFDAAAVGRLAVGFGDAFTFVSMIRLINGWFEGQKASRWQQWMGNLGQLGQILSAFPFALLLHATSWQVAFLSWASISAVASCLVWLLVTDERLVHHHQVERLSLGNAFRQLGVNLKSPFVRMSFWVHFTIQSPGTVMVLLWGMPFLVEAQGLTREQAASLLSMFVLVGIVFGVIYGQISAHRPSWRRGLVIVLYCLTSFAWLSVLSLSTAAPFWMLFSLFFVLGVSGPGSMLAFDFTKSYVPKIRLGSANGFVNIGGFLASFSMMFLIGWLLDLFHLTHKSLKLYSVEGFRFALVSQFAVLGIGITMFLIEFRKSKNAAVIRE